MSRTRLGYALVLLGVLAFSINAGVSRLVLDNGVDARTLAELRAIGAAVLLFLLIWATGRLTQLPIPRSDWPRLLVYGLIGLGLLQWLYFEAIARIPIGLAILIEFLAPLWVALWAKFVRGQVLKPTIWPALGITLTGLAIVAGAGLEGLDPLGVISALAASVCFAVYFLVGERLVGAYEPFVVSFWGFAVAAVGWLLAAAILEQVKFVWSVPATTPIAVGLAVVPIGLLLLWVISLGTVVPFAAETAAMRWVPATVVSVLAMLEPVGASVVGWWWFGQTWTWFQAFGAALVLTGITLALLSRSEHPTPAVID